MQALIDFLSAYEPLFPQVVKGHPPEEIERYERVLGVPLPSVYRDFLATMGENAGLQLDGYFIIDELIELADAKRPMLERLSYQLIPAASDLEGDQDYYIHIGRPRGAGDGHYVRSASGTYEFTDWHCSPSFRDYLFAAGFFQVRMLKMHQLNISWEQAELHVVEALLERLGFRALNVTGPTKPFYERGDCAAAVLKRWLGWELESSGEGLRRACSHCVYLGAQSKQTLEEVAETLRDNIPGQSRVWGRQYLDRPE